VEQAFANGIKEIGGTPVDQSNEVVDVTKTESATDQGLDHIVGGFQLASGQAVTQSSNNELAVTVDFLGERYKLGDAAVTRPL
jgi:hypothetical protein